MKKYFLLTLLVLPTLLLAQEVDVTDIELIEEKLPSYQSIEVDNPTNHQTYRERKFIPPHRVTRMDKIIESGFENGALRGGITVTDIETNENKLINRPLYVRAYRLTDENGFKYLVNKDGKIIYKVHIDYFDPITEITNLYVPPTKYNTYKVEKTNDYDGSLKILPEVGLGFDAVSSSFVADLLNDTTANLGFGTRAVANGYTKWKLPVKVGATLQFEQSYYKIDSGNAQVSGLSFGPLVRSKDLVVSETKYRFMGQLRLSPFTSMKYETETDSGTFKFNTYAALAALEFPIKNYYGNLVGALYYQQQFFNLKNQEQSVNLSSKTTSNQSFGLMLSQVFE